MSSIYYAPAPVGVEHNEFRQSGVLRFFGVLWKDGQLTWASEKLEEAIDSAKNLAWTIEGMSAPYTIVRIDIEHAPNLHMDNLPLLIWQGQLYEVVDPALEDCVVENILQEGAIYE